MDKLNVVSANMEYYLEIKRNEALIHATTQMNLEKVTLNSRKSQHKISYIQFILSAQNGKNSQRHKAD